MKHYRITHIKEVTTEEEFVALKYAHSSYQNAVLHLGNIVVLVCIKGRTCYWFCNSLCIQDRQVLALMVKFVKQWNKSFSERKQAKNPQLRFGQKSERKCQRQRRCQIKHKRKYKDYNAFAKIRNGFDHNIHYSHGKALVYTRVRGRTIHYYVVRNENGLDALEFVAQDILRNNERLKTRRRTAKFAA